MGVPVRVVDNDGVGGGEVDAQATGAGGQQEAEDVRPLIEALDGGLAVLPLDAAIDARCAVAQLLQIGVQDV